MYVYAGVFVNVCVMCVCVYMYGCVCSQSCMHICVRVCMHMHVCMCVYACVHVCIVHMYVCFVWRGEWIHLCIFEKQI